MNQTQSGLLRSRRTESHVQEIARLHHGSTVNCQSEEGEALSHYHRARSHFEEEGNLARLGELHFKRGMSLLAKKEFANALHEFELTRAFGTKADNPRLACLAKFGKANAYYQQKDFRVALRLVDQSLEGLWLDADRSVLAEVFLLKGKICRALRKYEFSEWFLQSSLRLYLDLQNKLGVAECSFHLGALLELRGRHSEARRLFEQSSGMCAAHVNAEKKG